MKNALSQIAADILFAVYQPFWSSVLLSVLLMFLYLYINEHGGALRGLRAAARIWRNAFLHDSRFRRLFLLSFYTTLILFRTLLNRDYWYNPLSDVMGGWIIIDGNGIVASDSVENILLFLPFTLLLFWAVGDRVLKNRKDFRTVLFCAAKIVFLFSLTIEFLQLILCLGTFQLSDLFYNTLGGCLGGILYWIIFSARKRGLPATDAEEEEQPKL